jgi:hypothetical protein
VETLQLNNICLFYIVLLRVLMFCKNEDQEKITTKKFYDIDPTLHFIFVSKYIDQFNVPSLNFEYLR